MASRRPSVLRAVFVSPFQMAAVSACSWGQVREIDSPLRTAVSAANQYRGWSRGFSPWSLWAGHRGRPDQWLSILDAMAGMSPPSARRHSGNCARLFLVFLGKKRSTKETLLEHNIWEFPPEPLAVRRVRQLMAEITGVPGDHAAVLIASELATNAVKHAKTPFEVAIKAEDSIRIEVVDQAPMTPVLTDPSKHGFGLRIVTQLSSRWGADQVEGNGKIVWAEVLS